MLRSTEDLPSMVTHGRQIIPSSLNHTLLILLTAPQRFGYTLDTVLDLQGFKVCL